MSAYQDDDDLLIPPENFCMVECGIYRSGFPGKKNFPFLKTLNLRTIVYLCPEEYPEANLNFLNSAHVQLLQFGVAGNKEPFLEIPHDIISEALVEILDTRNHPLLIHCNKGKHRTGCMVGVLRKVLGWSLSSIFEEYRVFSRPKERFMDQQFIECWQMCLPDDHPLIKLLHQYQQQRLITSGSGDSISSVESSSTSPQPTLQSLMGEKFPCRYLVNPEANEQLLRKEAAKAAAKEKERERAENTNNAAAAAALNQLQQLQTTPTAMVYQPSPSQSMMSTSSSESREPTPLNLTFDRGSSAPSSANRPLGQHHHALSQPNLAAFNRSY